MANLGWSREHSLTPPPAPQETFDFRAPIILPWLTCRQEVLYTSYLEHGPALPRKYLKNFCIVLPGKLATLNNHHIFMFVRLTCIIIIMVIVKIFSMQASVVSSAIDGIHCVF